MKIGLEVHCQLLTKSKLFCGCPNITAKEPNSVVCDYCIGLPGTKPRINKKAVDFAIQAALVLNCKIAGETFFSRKSYFYPDMAKNFQISQFEIPLAKNGWLKTGKKKIRITRLHMEEDPARIVHVGSITEAKYVLVDYNRSGTPLCEIVTAPDFADPKEARQFLQELSSILEYLSIFDPNIEGSMRVDSNISLDKNDMKEAKGIRVEIKNITGFKDVELALNYEIIRQKNMLRTGKDIVRETRAWDAAAGVTRSLRVKEEEEDYGYIFEGDLPKLTISKEKITEWVNKISKPYDKKNKNEELIMKLEEDVKNKINNLIDNEDCDEVELGSICEFKSGKFKKCCCKKCVAEYSRSFINYKEEKQSICVECGEKINIKINANDKNCLCKKCGGGTDYNKISKIIRKINNMVGPTGHGFTTKDAVIKHYLSISAGAWLHKAGSIKFEKPVEPIKWLLYNKPKYDIYPLDFHVSCLKVVNQFVKDNVQIVHIIASAYMRIQNNEAERTELNKVFLSLINEGLKTEEIKPYMLKDRMNLLLFTFQNNEQRFISNGYLKTIIKVYLHFNERFLQQ